VTSYTYNAANAMTMIIPPSAALPTTLSYDGNGNLTVEQTGAALTTHTWDGENRQLTYASPGTGTETSTYAAGGLRQRKVTPASTTNFIWDQQNVLLETNASNVTQAHCTDFPGVWGGLTSQRRGTSRPSTASICRRTRGC
jgi:uncharacterized protein RhaS with RHS repeats